MSVGHGLQDAAKTIGVVALALVSVVFSALTRPRRLWVYLMTAAVLAFGTYAGGWRIIRTLGRRIIHLGPPQGFAAETVASSVLFTAAEFGLPDLHHAHHHVGDHGSRRHEADLRGPLGSGRQHRRCLDTDVPSLGDHGGAGVVYHQTAG